MLLKIKIGNFFNIKKNHKILLQVTFILFIYLK
jgi:hypothetical protein